MRRLFDYECLLCGHTFEDFLEVGELPHDCPKCTGRLIQEIYLTAPSVRTDNNSASYLDGTVRKGMKELSKSYQLEAEMCNLAPKDRGEHEKEIANLRKVKV